MYTVLVTTRYRPLRLHSHSCIQTFPLFLLDRSKKFNAGAFNRNVVVDRSNSSAPLLDKTRDIFYKSTAYCVITRRRMYNVNNYAILPSSESFPMQQNTILSEFREHKKEPGRPDTHRDIAVASEQRRLRSAGAT